MLGMEYTNYEFILRAMGIKLSETDLAYGIIKHFGVTFPFLLED